MPTTRHMSFDQTVFFLAEDFLDQEADMKTLTSAHQERVKSALAGDIQGTIEDFVNNLREGIREAAR
jgi:hypothetical protein